MSQLAITRGRPYTVKQILRVYDNYGLDIGSEYDGDFCGEDTPLCDHCDEVCSWTWGFPVILQEDSRWFTTMYFNQCDRCHQRAQAIMDTSDHLALGKDEWDLIDSATEIIMDERWDAFPKWTMESAKQAAQAKMDHIETMRVKLEEKDDEAAIEAVPFFGLVPDVVDVIQSKLAEAEYHSKRENAARIIQKGWKGLRERILKRIEAPYPCGICGVILDVSDSWANMFTVDDKECNTAHPICYQECQILCRSCGYRQGVQATPDDVSLSPGTCNVCGTSFTCFAHR